MSRNFATFLVIVSAGMLLTATLEAADPLPPAEARLREALRNTVIQLRNAQNDSAALQAANGELDRKNKDLSEQVKQLAQRGAADKETAEKTIADLNTKLAAQAEEMAKLKEAFAQTQAKLNETAALAQSREAERTKLAADVVLLRRITDEQKTKNAEMYRLGKEILLRYEKFGLGEVLGAKEPFVGTMRVKLETYVQDFQDKLSAQKTKP